MSIIAEPRWTDRRAFLKQASIAGAVATILPVSGAAAAIELNKLGALPRMAAKLPRRTAKAAVTAAALRDLWIGHIFWVRNVSVATLNNDSPATKTAEQQVVANAKSIAATIQPFYGVSAEQSLFELLASHYGAVKAYLIATAGDDSAAQARATESLTSNAEEIAIFLSRANPHLPKQVLNRLLLAHGGHHIQQIQELKDRNYDAEAKTWEDMKAHIYNIADATADALAKQFATKFS
jgi:hypothetical protein